MSELAGEMSAPVERESGAIRRVAERVGNFLSETYTIKGAKAKEMRGMDQMYAHFTRDQRQEMQDFFDARAAKNAKWKVIRNWVVTGAGLALGTTLLTRPDLVVNALVVVGKTVSGWWKGAVDAIGAATGAVGTAAGAAAEKAGVATEAVKGWVFDIHHRPVWELATPKTLWATKGVPVGEQIGGTLSSIGESAATGLKAMGGDQLAEAYTATKLGIQPLFASIREGLKIPLPVIAWK